MILDFKDFFVTEIYSHLANCLFFLAKKLAKQTILVSGQQNFARTSQRASHTNKKDLMMLLYEGCNKSISRAQFMCRTLYNWAIPAAVNVKQSSSCRDTCTTEQFQLR
jgi:hypothetical protein